jgi:hypothetical protein
MKRSARHLAALWLGSGVIVLLVLSLDVSTYWLVVGPLLLGVADVLLPALVRRTTPDGLGFGTSARHTAEVRMAQAAKRQHRADLARKEAEVDWSLAQSELREAHYRETLQRTERKLALLLGRAEPPDALKRLVHQLIPELGHDHLDHLDRLLDDVRREREPARRREAEGVVIDQLVEWLESTGEEPPRRVADP